MTERKYDYNDTQLATFDVQQPTPKVLEAWAKFAAAVQSQYPDAVLEAAWSGSYRLWAPEEPAARKARLDREAEIAAKKEQDA